MQAEPSLLLTDKPPGFNLDPWKGADLHHLHFRCYRNLVLDQLEQSFRGRLQLSRRNIFVRRFDEGLFAGESEIARWWLYLLKH